MSSERNYEVGYGKPPKSTQFKKGQSGNPKGRPVGSQNLSTGLRYRLNEKVTITENGVRRQITAQDALIKQLIRMALSGNLKAFQQVLALEQAAELAESQTSPVARNAEPRDLQKLLRRLTGSLQIEEEHREA